MYIKSKTSRSIGVTISVIILSILMMTALFSAPAQAEAQAPEWEEGDSWAMGYREDSISEMFGPGIEQAKDDLEDPTSDDMKVDTEVNGEMGFYQIYEVTEAGESGYTLDIEAGGGVKVSGSLEMTGEMLPEGEHDMSEDDLDKVNKTVSMSGNVHYSQDITGTAELNSEYAIESIELKSVTEVSGSYDFENVPEEDYDYINETKTMEYKDYSGSISGDVTVEVTVEFDEPLDFFDFPIEEGEEWETNSTISITGTYEGKVDVTGLPDEAEEDIENEFDQEFPMTLEEIDTSQTEGLDEGDIDLPPPGESDDINVPLKCTGTETIVLEDGTETEVYNIEFGHGNSLSPQSFKMQYSEEKGFIVEQKIVGGPEMGDYMDTTEMSMSSMDVNEARNEMNDIQEEDGNGDDGGLMPGFTVPVLAIGIMVSIYLYEKNWKRKHE